MLQVEVGQQGKLKPRDIKHGAWSLWDSSGRGSMPTASNAQARTPHMYQAARAALAPLTLIVDGVGGGQRGRAGEPARAKAAILRCEHHASVCWSSVVDITPQGGGEDFQALLSNPTTLAGCYWHRQRRCGN